MGFVPASASIVPSADCMHRTYLGANHASASRKQMTIFLGKQANSFGDAGLLRNLRPSAAKSREGFECCAITKRSNQLADLASKKSEWVRHNNMRAASS